MSFLKRLAGGSVLARLLLAVALSGLATALVGGWLIASSAGEALRAEIDQQNEALARSLASRLDDRVRTQIEALETNATRSPVEELGPDTQSELNVLMKTRTDLDRLSAYSADGSPVATAAPRGGADVDQLPPRPQLARRLAERRSVSTLDSTVPPTVELAVPVERPPGTVVGFLVAELPAEELARPATDLQFEPTRSAFVVDSSGTIVVHRQRDRVVNRERFELPRDRGDSGRPFSATRDSEPFLFASAPTSMLLAEVVVEQREGDALASIRAVALDLVAILLAVVAVSGIVVGLVGRSLLAPLRPMSSAARRIAGGDHAARVPTHGSGEVGRLGMEFNNMAEALQRRIAELEDRKAAEQRLREQTYLAETLNRVGAALTAELELEQVVQAVTDLATDLVGADFGAFFYNVEDEYGESFLLYSLAGVSKEAFEDFPMPRNTAIFGPTFRGEAPVRIDDVTEHPHYGHNSPYFGMPEGHLPVRSYLAVSVVSRTGEVVGGLFFGHSAVGVFSERDEQLVSGIAAQAAVAIDNARLYETQRGTAEVLQRSLLPDVQPTSPGSAAAARYLPAHPSLDVGGDWYDVIELESGKVGLVVGDVVGRGVAAAATMGRLCHALRAYAFEDPSPATVLGKLNHFAQHVTGEGRFATVLYALYDPAEATLLVASAGHPPLLLVTEGGSTQYVQGPVGLPVGAVAGESYAQSRIPLPASFKLLFYTDGLVEDRELSLDRGLERLKNAAAAPGDAGRLCDSVIKAMGRGRDGQDDVALLVFSVGDPPSY